MNEPTKADIEKWKTEHGANNVIKITSRATGKYTIVRTNPSVREMDAALSAGSNGGLGYSKVLHSNLALFTSPNCEDADMLAFYTRIGETIKINDADLEKL